jgi:hypothetical protein
MEAPSSVGRSQEQVEIMEREAEQAGNRGSGAKQTMGQSGSLKNATSTQHNKKHSTYCITYYIKREQTSFFLEF